jgi:LmbE family N-acetylglucosaminyl deacetylase/SAM-dependent methyltransferase
VIIAAPHPDDETLGAGGVIARLEDAHIRVIVVVVTDGGESARSAEVLPEAQVARRGQELRRALQILAPSTELYELGIPDGCVDQQRPTTKRALMERILADPPSLVIAPWSGDGHRGHRLIGEICEEFSAPRAIRLAQYPIWMRHWADPESAQVPWERFRGVDLTAGERRLKVAAIGLYSPQTEASEERPATLQHEFVRHFVRPKEVYLTSSAPLPVEYFDTLYARHDDPWLFEARWYEKCKRALTMGALPRDHYGSVLEVGCSIGLLSAELAVRADRIHAIDTADHAVAATRARVAGYPGVIVEQHDFPKEIPAGPFDLIVLSEVGSYLDAESLEHSLRNLLAALAPGGELLLCHWHHEVEDYPLTGDAVHRAADALAGVERFIHYVDADFILALYSADPRSVAQRTGLS